MQLKWLEHSAGKIGYFALCKLFSRFMSRCPISGVELRLQVHPQKFWFVENCGEIPENPGTEVSTRLYTIELSDFFIRKKHFWSSASVSIAEHEKLQLSLSGKCSMVWIWAKTNEGLLIGFKSSHLSFAAPPNFHCVWLFASVNK